MRVEREHEPERDVAADPEEDDVPEGDVAGVAHDHVHARGERDEHEDEEELLAQARVVRDDRERRDERDHQKDERQERDTHLDHGLRRSLTRVTRGGPPAAAAA